MDNLPIKVSNYLAAHGLDPVFVHEKLGWNWTDSAITIPVYDQNSKKLYDKIRNLDHEENLAADLKSAKFVFDPAGSHPSLYCAHLIAKRDNAVLCEGEPDAANLWQHGIPAVTSTGGVTKFSPEMAQHLIGKQVYLFLDNDRAGQGNILKIAELLTSLNINVKIGKLPEEYKDISEYFANGGDSTTFKQLIAEAVTINGWLIKDKEITNPIFDLVEFAKHDLPASKWLINRMVRASGVTFWVGLGGVGKTSILYTVAKAVAEGTKWLNQHQATRGRVLILDKENEPVDVQNSLRAMDAINPNIFYYSTARDFSFLDDSGELTPEALYIRAFCQEKQITAVVIDSMVDFFVGNENDAIFAALNLNAWVKTFPDISINVIHHENKEIPNQKRSASGRMRGSSHLFNGAQGVLSFSTIDEETPERIKVEHTKVRGARKIRPFEIQMIVAPDPANQGETIITGFKLIGEIQESLLKGDQAKEAILLLFEKNFTTEYTTADIVNALAPIHKERTIKAIIPELRAKGLVAWRIEGKNLYKYKAKIVDNSVDNFIENIEENE